MEAFNDTREYRHAHAREPAAFWRDLEKQALIWIARRLPRFINSDHLSALGLTAMAAAGLSFAAYPRHRTGRHSAWSSRLRANWFGDSLDGTVARVRQSTTAAIRLLRRSHHRRGRQRLLLTGMAFSGSDEPARCPGVLASFLLVSAESLSRNARRRDFPDVVSRLWTDRTANRDLAIGAIKAAMSPWAALGSFGHRNSSISAASLRRSAC